MVLAGGRARGVPGPHPDPDTVDQRSPARAYELARGEPRVRGEVPMVASAWAPPPRRRSRTPIRGSRPSLVGAAGWLILSGS
jgi:hypothetical protein